VKIHSHHLGYCSNIHAGEEWISVRQTLGEVLPALRRQLKWEGPLGFGLRLSAAAAATLDDPPVLDEFRAFLRSCDSYVFTINGFPYGAFHGTRVKERVYEPDWRDPRRVSYTNTLATLLTTLTEADVIASPSVSTVPGGFRDHIRTDRDRADVADGIVRHLAHLVHLRQTTGRIVTLAIEPEPACYMETTAEVLSVLSGWIQDPDRLDAIGRETGVRLSLEDVRRHIGVCLDACHLAVAFEQPAEAIARIHAAGFRIFKVQVSSALHIAGRSADSVRSALGRFSEDTYLHQVVERLEERFTRYVDLPDALQAAREGHAGAGDWRVHFHVPIFLESMGTFDTTQGDLRSTIEAVCAAAACDQFEVETYTWDVLPPEWRTTDVVTSIARELLWARAVLEGAR
jgi:sugar phosphate isomerase/epimerase